MVLNLLGFPAGTLPSLYHQAVLMVLAIITLVFAPQGPFPPVPPVVSLLEGLIPAAD